MSREVHIVCAADERFAMPLAIMLRSVVTSCAGRIHAYVLSNDLSEKAKSEIEAVCARHDRPPLLHWLEAESQYLDDVPPTLAHLSRAAYLRLGVGRLISRDVKRVLYLDSDLLVVRDLAPLMEMALDGNAVAACQDFWTPIVRMPNALGYCYEEEKIPADHPLFNSGVMVIDLENYREQGIEQKCVDFIRRWQGQVQAADQDALNAVLWNRWKSLDIRWNLQIAAFEHYRKRFLPESYSRIKLEELDPAILHFSGANKPWNSGLRSRPCSRYVRSVRDSGWFGKTGFQIWNAKRFAVCIRSAAVNRFAGLRARSQLAESMGVSE